MWTEETPSCLDIDDNVAEGVVGSLQQAPRHTPVPTPHFHAHRRVLIAGLRIQIDLMRIRIRIRIQHFFLLWLRIQGLMT
jgi:hypothetical protein